MPYVDRVFFTFCIPAHSKLTVENIMLPASSSQQHGIFPSWNSGRWIPQQSEEEVMTQVAVKPTADNQSFTCVSYLSSGPGRYMFSTLTSSDSGPTRKSFKIV